LANTLQKHGREEFSSSGASLKPPFLSVSGVQIAYFAIIGTQLFMMLLSVVLLAGVVKVSLSHFNNLPRRPIRRQLIFPIHSIVLENCRGLREYPAVVLVFIYAVMYSL